MTQGTGVRLACFDPSPVVLHCQLVFTPQRLVCAVRARTRESKRAHGNTGQRLGWPREKGRQPAHGHCRLLPAHPPEAVRRNVSLHADHQSKPRSAKSTEHRTPGSAARAAPRHWRTGTELTAPLISPTMCTLAIPGGQDKPRQDLLHSNRSNSCTNSCTNECTNNGFVIRA